MRNRFDKQLSILNEELIQMGALIESSISSAVKAFTENNEDYALTAIEYDKQVDQKERDIERLCLKLLLEQQPVARDLRLISAALKMITDMERIGDQSSDIAEIALTMPKDNHDLSQIHHITKMAKATITMVNNSIDAFVKKNIVLANDVIRSDDEVDNMFDIVREEIVKLIRLDSQNAEYALDMLMVTKYFERIGDHATNIAEWVLFSISGKHID